MPKPEVNWITFEIDGREVRAPEGAMLVDGAKYGDVEIPYFCYEPKLGQPVGACRMCLVEIEGIPKLQTACSTAVKDGMVVITTSDKVKHAQNAVVEFLLVNHPLDCPVCDKGGECPLQDISFGWGVGHSRMIEPKRHFKKPVELSPMVAIDRERCILCYRCVRFSQEISEDYQLVFLDRGDHTFVGTHAGRPYVAPFSGNIIELCPVGALTSTAYRFRARPWDVEGAGSVCTLCPAQCNVEFTVRDDSRVLRVLDRQNDEVDDGWLCDKGRFAYQAIRAEDRITEPMVRQSGQLRPVPWEQALSAAAAGLKGAGDQVAGVAGGATTNEEAFLLQKLVREACGSAHVHSRPAAPDPARVRALAAPGIGAAVPEIDYAGAVLVLDTELVDDAPILDLRVRKAVRRHQVPLVVMSSRPSTLDPNAAAVVRYAPGAGEAALAALHTALGLGKRKSKAFSDLCRRAGAEPDSVRGAAALLGEEVVLLWGERLGSGERRDQALDALLAVIAKLGARHIEIPTEPNGRGLREAGCHVGLGPGLSEADSPEEPPGKDAAIVLLNSDLEAPPDGTGPVIAFAQFLSPFLSEHATVVFPAESYAERDGTVTHPDGRLQRVRQAVGRPGEVLPGWRVLEELLGRLGKPTGATGAPMVFRELQEAAPILSGLTYEEIGGTGARWQERDAAGAVPASGLDPGASLETPPEPGAGGFTLGAVRSLWSGPEIARSPVLRFLSPEGQAELSAADGRRLGVATGDAVEVRSNGSAVRARARLRTAQPEGWVFLVDPEADLPEGPVEVSAL